MAKTSDRRLPTKVLEVEARVEEIRGKAEEGAEDAAHAMENQLLEDVLRAIASGVVASPRNLARAALASKEIYFRRVCA